VGTVTVPQLEVRKLKRVLWIGIAVVAVIAIAAGNSGSKKASSSSSSEAFAPAASATPVSTVTGRWSHAMMDEPLDEANLED
jgi:hypothetical protein